MEITGTITRVFEVVTGNGRKGMWSKQSFILEQPGQYPKPVCVDLWGEDLITKYDLVVGLTVTAHINLESREYSGRWYTDVRCWKLTWNNQQKRNWQPGGETNLAGSAADIDERKGIKAQEQSLGTGPLDDTQELPF